MDKNILTNRVSLLLDIEYSEAESIINTFFQRVSDIIANKSTSAFYLNKVGTISTKYDIEQYVETDNKEYKYYPPKFYIDFSENLESQSLTVRDIKVNYTQEGFSLTNKYRKVVAIIRNILNDGNNVYVDKFGIFSKDTKNIFTPSDYLMCRINPYFNLSERNITKDEYVKYFYKDMDTANFLTQKDRAKIIEEIVEDHIDTVYNEHSTNTKDIDIDIDLTEIIEKIKKTTFEEKTEDIDDSTKNDDVVNNNEIVEEIKNTLDDNDEPQDTIVDKVYSSNIDEIIEYDDNDTHIIEYDIEPKKDKRYMTKMDNHNIEMESFMFKNRPYTYKLDLIEHIEQKPLKKSVIGILDSTLKNNNTKVSKKSTLKIFFFSFTIIVLITFSAILIKKTNMFKHKIEYTENINEELFDIVNNHFVGISNTNDIAYILSENQYFWDMSKDVYKDSLYWPLIFALNETLINSTDILGKGTNINYRELSKNKRNRDLDITLAKSYISLYEILEKENRPKHAKWVVKLAAYFDFDTFENSKDIIPEDIYNEVLNNKF